MGDTASGIIRAASNLPSFTSPSPRPADPWRDMYHSPPPLAHAAELRRSASVATSVAASAARSGDGSWAAEDDDGLGVDGAFAVSPLSFPMEEVEVAAGVAADGVGPGPWPMSPRPSLYPDPAAGQEQPDVQFGTDPRFSLYRFPFAVAASARDTADAVADHVMQLLGCLEPTGAVYSRAVVSPSLPSPPTPYASPDATPQAGPGTAVAVSRAGSRGRPAKRTRLAGPPDADPGCPATPADVPAHVDHARPRRPDVPPRPPRRQKRRSRCASAHGRRRRSRVSTTEVAAAASGAPSPPGLPEGGTCPRRTLLSADQKRLNHNGSEKRRREHIARGYEAIRTIRPGHDNSDKSKSVALSEAIFFLRMLLVENFRHGAARPPDPAFPASFPPRPLCCEPVLISANARFYSPAFGAPSPGPPSSSSAAVDFSSLPFALSPSSDPWAVWPLCGAAEEPLH